MAKWTVVDKNGARIVVDALYPRVESGGCLVVMGMGDVNGFHQAVRIWAPGEWRSFEPGGEDACTIVARRADELRARADGVERVLREMRSHALGTFSVREPRGWQDVAALRTVADELTRLSHTLR